jgi:hypothetical protein
MKTRLRLRSTLPAVIASTALLGFAGCGSDDSEESTSESTESSVSTATVDTATVDTVRAPVSDETAATYDAAAAEYNAASVAYGEALAQAQTASGGIDIETLQAETRTLRDALFKFDEVIRGLDFTGYEVEVNALLDANAAHIANLDEVTTNTEDAQIETALTATAASAVEINTQSDALLTALNNG